MVRRVILEQGSQDHDFPGTNRSCLWELVSLAVDDGSADEVDGIEGASEGERSHE